MEPHENYLRRKPGTKEHQQLLDINANVLDECVNYGTHCLTWCTEKITNQNNYELTPIMLIRHVLEILDSISVLYRQGCINSSEPLLRSLFEAILGINYILKEDTKRRALAYQISNQIQRLSTYRKIEKSILQNSKFHSHKTRLEKLKGGILSNSQQIQRKIKNKEVVKIINEWYRVRNFQKRNPNWFSLFEGPQSIQALAGELGYRDWYDSLYRKWSTGVHATDTFNNIVRQGQRAMILGLRDQRNLQAYSSLALSMAITTYRSAIQYFAPQMEIDFSQWYVSSIRNWYLRLASEEKLINISR